MTPLISLSGPHAVGKTTAVYRWLRRYPKLLGVIADNQWESQQGADGEIVQTRVREWKGSVQQKGDLVQSLRDRKCPAVIDSVRTTAINFFKPQDFSIFVTCSWQTMEKNLRARCEKNGKKYNAAYWDKRKLEYESRLRYENAADKYLKPSQCFWFTIEDYDRDWPDVDDCFSTLYRKIHNELVRGTWRTHTTTKT